MEVPCLLRFWSCISRTPICIEDSLLIELRPPSLRIMTRLSISTAPPALPASWDWAWLRARCLGEAGRVLPRAEAEEAVQEALVRAWRLSGECRAPEMPLPWMLKITRNEALRVVARKARLSNRELSGEVAALSAEEDAEHAITTRMTVQQALQDLEDTDRRVLRLRYDEDLTQAEVARRLGMPEGTVKIRLHRARRRLRTSLAETDRPR
jgi:RNA polymerase sigma-70 factor, ECF subfamily